MFAGYSQRMATMRKLGPLADSEFHHDEWDADPYGPAVVVDADGTFRMFYTAYQQGGGRWGICVATSTDHIKWTKPVLNLTEFQGSTANNIVGGIPYDRLQFCDVCVHDGEYIMSVRNDDTGTNMVYTSADGESFRFRSIVSRGGDHPDWHGEIKAILYDDGEYRAYYTDGHQQQRRSIGFRTATSLDGPWTGMYAVDQWTARTAELQFYDVSFWRHDNRVWACVPVYNSVTEVLGPLRSYYSNDDDYWVQHADLLRNGPGNGFDAGIITNATPLFVNGHRWEMIYSASPWTHNVSPRPHRLCLAVVE